MTRKPQRTGAAFGQQTKPSPGVLEYATSPVPVSTNRWLPPIDKAPPAPATDKTTGYFPSMKALAPIPSPPGWKPMALLPATLPQPEKVVITNGQGGLLSDHYERFARYSLAHTNVELRGPCYSACTLVASYLDKDKLCIAPGAFLAFHAARSKANVRMDDDTWRMYMSYPNEIQRWIDRHGGYMKLPMNGYWTLYYHELWAMGYPKCK